MTAREQLNALCRQFPDSRELAVSPALRDQYLAEMTAAVREVSDEAFEAIPPARRSRLLYRNRRLVCVEP